jgi:hypothetical protein
MAYKTFTASTLSISYICVITQKNSQYSLKYPIITCIAQPYILHSQCGTLNINAFIIHQSNVGLKFHNLRYQNPLHSNS